MITKKNISAGELTKEYNKRNYKDKSPWTYAQWIILMESEPDTSLICGRTKKRWDAVRFGKDRVYNLISRDMGLLQVGFAHHDENMLKAFENANIHSGYYKITLRRIKKKIKKLNITEKILKVVED